MSFLSVIPFCLADAGGLLSPLAARLERAFHLEVRVSPAGFDPELCYDGSRGQYHSTRLLGQLLAMPGGPARILGVTGVDLFIPVLTYVFGEAQLEGRAAVVSIHRLRNEAYGLPPSDALLLERLEKESVHELGHTFNLVHCHDPACVMHASTYVEDIDLKSCDFCSSCDAGVRAAQVGAR
jgi:archaemetzincin